MAITIIIGEPGSGKTALMSYFQEKKMEEGLIDYISCKKMINVLSDGGFLALAMPPQKHLCFSDYGFKLNIRNKSYIVNGFEIALENPYFKTIKFPPYSSIFLDEAQKYYDSRMSKYLREEVYRWFQLHRHSYLNIFMTCQRLGNIDLNIRAIANRIIVVDELKVKEDDYGQTEKITWKCREFTSCDTAERYLLAKENKEVSKLGKELVITTDSPVFEYYDSHECLPVFFNNMYSNKVVKFDYFFEDDYEFTIDSFTEFNNKHYFVCPQGYLKNPKRDEEILKERGIV